MILLWYHLYGLSQVFLSLREFVARDILLLLAIQMSAAHFPVLASEHFVIFKHSA